METGVLTGHMYFNFEQMGGTSTALTPNVARLINDMTISKKQSERGDCKADTHPSQ
ncbi:hypothetical protein DM01DRAFT_1335257 [Hesseltinella vesiculosa]|uniref:Uncharacterized protein n=1 Tax=Hesseltinella vesiculosa TaxID=101127 RepID=A0A1X2GJ01_9FUNG|nr:hypothetical protein DM01DRAFT_1335257 [Hesseltinella vesiculosa]